MALAAAALALSCRRDAAPTAAAAGPTVDLLARFFDVDCRSDTLDLPFLLSRTLLERRGLEEVREAGAPVWVWMAGAEARVDLPFLTAGAKTARLRARCKVAYGPRLPLVVSLNGRVLATLELTPAETDYVVEIPSSAQVPGRNELRLEARSAAANPRRPVMLTRLDVAPAGAAKTSAPSRSADGLWLGGAAVRYPVHVPGPGVELEIAARSGPGGGGRVTVAVESGGGTRELAAVSASGPDRAPARVSVPAGPVARLVISGSDAQIAVLRLRLPAVPAPPSPSTPPVRASRPSLVLFLADAVRADLLSAYGNPHPTSPRFDIFAREGWLFEDATAQSAATRPSVASLLTGLGVDAHGVVGQGSTIAPALTTLPEALRAAGYATAAFVANDVLSPVLGYAQGFDSWNVLPRRPSAEVVRAALQWTRERRAPFFIYVHTLGAHRPYVPAAEYWRPFLPATVPRERDVNALVLRPRLSAAELDYVRSAYEGEIREDDAAFTELLDGLRAQGALANAAVAFTADHGEAFDEHGHRGHGFLLYQETAHVPLALSVPGAVGGRRIGAPVQHIDIAPTLLALAGAPTPPEMIGADLATLGASAREGAPPGRLLVSRLTYAGADKVAVRWGSLKLIVNEEPDTPFGGRFELYDLAADPRESKNLAAARPETVEYLWMESRALRSVEEGLRARVGSGRKVELSPEDKEALRALGYVE